MPRVLPTRSSTMVAFRITGFLFAPALATLLILAQGPLQGGALLCLGFFLLFYVCLPLAIYTWNTRTGERALGLGSLSTRHRRILSLSLVAMPMLMIGFGAEPYVDPERFIPTLERTSAPLISAIDRHTAEHGAPPESLDELVPEYLAEVPPSGYRGDPSFHYGAWGDRKAGWELHVDCETFGIFFCDMLRIVSTDRRWRWIDDRD